MAFLNRLITSAISTFVAASTWAVQVNVPVLNQEPEVDGKITPAETAATARITMTRLGGFDRPSQPTDVYVGVTRTGLYVAFDAKESVMDSLVTSATRENGAVFDDDSFQIFLSAAREATANNYFHFAVNSVGTKYSNSAWDNDKVDGWIAAVTKGVNGWHGEILIPLSAINAPDELPFWRANFSRVRPARNGEPEEISAWVNPGITLHNYNRFGFLSMPSFLPSANYHNTTAGESLTTYPAISRETTGVRIQN